MDEVLIRKNQKIVDEGEIITQEIYDKLVALNLVSETGLEGSLMPMLGSLVITGMLLRRCICFSGGARGIFS